MELRSRFITFCILRQASCQVSTSFDLPSTVLHSWRLRNVWWQEIYLKKDSARYPQSPTDGYTNPFHFEVQQATSSRGTALGLCQNCNFRSATISLKFPTTIVYHTPRKTCPFVRASTIPKLDQLIVRSELARVSSPIKSESSKRPMKEEDDLECYCADDRCVCCPQKCFI